LFQVGVSVRTTTRKQANVNIEGGVATVTKVSVNSGAAFYDVKYNDSARTESMLPESILTGIGSTRAGLEDLHTRRLLVCHRIEKQLS
jgi:hypothetical protein